VEFSEFSEFSELKSCARPKIYKKRYVAITELFRSKTRVSRSPISIGSLLFLSFLVKKVEEAQR
jgi:hypothetical protein